MSGLSLPEHGEHAEPSGLWEQVLASEGSRWRGAGLCRVSPATRTRRRFEPLREVVGITRLAEVTGLDRVGIPVFQAIRPGSRNISVSQGKGVTREQARVSALMESLESFHAEELRHPVRRASVRELRSELGYEPSALMRGPPPPDETVLDWIPATRLTTGAGSWVPRACCELDFSVVERIHIPLFHPSSNGLASGNTIAEALLHGLCELIERDSEARRPEARLEPALRVARSTLSSPVLERLLSRFDAAGLAVGIIDLTGPAGVPCFEVLAGDGQGLHRGLGCHPERELALIRALTECAQARVAQIAGSRDDLFRETYETTFIGAEDAPGVLELAPRRDFRDIADEPVLDLTRALRSVVARVQALTGCSPLAVDLTRPELGVPVVRVVAPGLCFQPPERRGAWLSLPRREMGADTAGARRRRGRRPRARRRVVVHVGPSIPPEELMPLLGALKAEVTLRPPVQQGDLLRLLTDPPEAVAILDGYFGHSPAVMHKEILLLLARGTRVLGGASLGALRAAELDRYGMEGVGEIYQLYRSGSIERDDEVALMHAPREEGYRPLTTALVDIRATLQLAREQAVVSARTASVLLACARKRHFSERCYLAIGEDARTAGADAAELARFREFVKRHAVDLKRRDARALLRLLAEREKGASPWPELRPARAVVTKHLLAHLRDYVSAAGLEGAPGEGLVLGVYKLMFEEAPRRVALIRRRCLAADEALARGVQPEADGELLERFRRAYRLGSSGELMRWLKPRGLSLEDCLALQRERCLERRLYGGGARRGEGKASFSLRALEQAVASRLGVSPQALEGPLFMSPGVPFDAPLLRELKVSGAFQAASAEASRLLRAVAMVIERVPHALGLPDEEQLRLLAARLWGVRPAVVARESSRRGFIHEGEFIQAARLLAASGMVSWVLSRGSCHP